MGMNHNICSRILALLNAQQPYELLQDGKTITKTTGGDSLGVGGAALGGALFGVLGAVAVRLLLHAFKIISWKLLWTDSCLKIKVRQMKIYLTVLIILTMFCIAVKAEQIGTNDPMILHPEWYIKISDWSVYGTWSAVAIIHHVTIENTSDTAYKNIRVRVYYTSTSTAQQAIIISQETGVLPITLPPHSKNTYLKGGVTLGAGSQFMNPIRIEVLGATPGSD